MKQSDSKNVRENFGVDPIHLPNQLAGPKAKIEDGPRFDQWIGEHLSREMAWLEACRDARIEAMKSGQTEVLLPQPPAILPEESYYGTFVVEKELSKAERLVLALAMAPHIAPNIFNVLHNTSLLAQYAKLIQSSNQISLLPTGETALFFIGGIQVEQRFRIRDILTVDHFFYKENILELGRVGLGEPESWGILSLSPQYRERFVYNREMRPRFSEDFPADLSTTSLEWEDLVLAANTERKIDELKHYLSRYEEMVKEWGMAKHARPGCRILFHGEPGTGKTLVATLLGKLLRKQVFRVDLSLVTSKYVGETSKRLRNLFNTAESKGWILFFDEGDAILGQRKNMTADSPGSQYANQDTAFLLQRIEQYDGVVVVATNFRANIDHAFTRRFEHIVKFNSPERDQLVTLWEQTMPANARLETSIDLKEMLGRFMLSPADIVSIVHRACLMAFVRDSVVLSHNDVLLCFRDLELRNKGMGIAR